MMHPTARDTGGTQNQRSSAVEPFVVASLLGLLLIVFAAPLSGQEKLYLYTRASPTAPENPLPVKTVLRVYSEAVREPADTVGRNVAPGAVPPTAQPLQDTIGDAVGNTRNAYAIDHKRTRYLVIAKTSDGILYWSVNQFLTQPRYHTLDRPARIRMQAVPGAHRDRVERLFTGQSTGTSPLNSGSDTNAVAPGSTTKEGEEQQTGETDLAWLIPLLAGIALGAAGAWFLGKSKVHKYKEDARSWEHKYDSLKKREELHAEHLVALATQLEGMPAAIIQHVTDNLEDLRAKILGPRDPSTPPPVDQLPALSRLHSTSNDHWGDESDGYDSLNVIDLPGTPATRATSTGGESAQDKTSRVAAVFVEWCHTAGGNVNRVKDFSEAIRSRLRGAEVRVLRRDRDNNGITFVSDGAGDPVEYWMVTVGGASILLPRPLNQERFKELHPVYEGKADPQSLRSIEPAFIRQEGANWVLEAPGRVS